MSNFETETPTMQVAANHVLDVNSNVQQELSNLLSRLEPLMAAWQGSASVSFHDLKERWHQNAGILNDALMAIGEDLHQSEQNYSITEDTNTQGFTGMAGNLD